MIRTDVPMIDVFNSLVESQKIPIFSVAGRALQPAAGAHRHPGRCRHHRLRRARADLRRLLLLSARLRGRGRVPRTVMFVNQASDPVVERLLVPDMALAVAEKFAVEERSACSCC
jgi:V/A-type H+/Na+-transporting ATPase subunit B